MLARPGARAFRPPGASKDVDLRRRAPLTVTSACTFDATGLSVPSQLSAFGDTEWA